MPIISDRYSFASTLLVVEIIALCFLSVRLPYAIRKKIFYFMSMSPIVTWFAYIYKGCYIYVAIIFLGALYDFYDATSELRKPSNTKTEANLMAMKYHAEKNVYLIGFTIFLWIVRSRMFSIALNLIRTTERYAKLKRQSLSMVPQRQQAEENAEEDRGVDGQVTVINTRRGQRLSVHI